MLFRVFRVMFLSLALVQAVEPSPVATLSSLLDTVKIDAFDGERAANRRLRKMMFGLETARLAGADPEAVMDSTRAILP